ncbi:MAG: hypothetical protein R3E39_15675 [Anaerolineae bacterium]
MNFLVLLLGLAVSLVTPARRKRRKNRSGSYQRYYRHGFMADEIDALESILDSEDMKQSRRRRR